jgi:hypothetical protein
MVKMFASRVPALDWEVRSVAVRQVSSQIVVPALLLPRPAREEQAGPRPC